MAEQHPLRDAGLALSLLTVVPTPARWPADDRTQVAAWFPAVGALFGLVGYAIVKAAQAARVTPHAAFVVAAVVVAVWALGSRLLHWDGLADVADAYWGSDDRERRLEIMADSRTGAFGATAVALVAILEVAAVATVIAAPHELPLLLVPVVGRFSATAGAWLGTPAKASGLGRSVLGPPTSLALLVGLVPLVGAVAGMWMGFQLTGLAVGAVGIVLAFAVPHVLAQRFGGVTGDVLGTSVLVTETLVFVTFALMR